MRTLPVILCVYIYVHRYNLTWPKKIVSTIARACKLMLVKRVFNMHVYAHFNKRSIQYNVPADCSYMFECIKCVYIYFNITICYN